MSQTNGSPEPQSLAELPPVEPPTAGFIVQLFVVPALIVVVVIAVWLLFGKLAGGERDASDYLVTICSGNFNQRWRAAYELASLIQNDAKLARDPVLLGQMTGALDKELAKPGDDPRVPQYLALSLGAFQTLEARSPAGVRLDPLASLARALGPGRPEAVRVMAAISLGRLGARFPGKLEHEGAVTALARALEQDDAELRQRAAYSLGYFPGEPASEALRQTLDRENVPAVRYDTAVALTRRGDPAARGVLREMLSPTDLAQVVRGQTDSETQRRIEAIALEALWALQEATRQGKPTLAQGLRADVAELGRVGSPSVRMEVGTLLKSLPPGP